MSIDTARLRDAIQAVYGEVADDPKKGYHFHTGPTYAVEHLRYAAADLEDLPDSVSGPFAGVGAPLSLGAPRLGEIVLDIGAGSGVDTFLAAKAVGATGRVIAVSRVSSTWSTGRASRRRCQHRMRASIS
jgi:arsenite methyltransferase